MKFIIPNFFLPKYISHNWSSNLLNSCSTFDANGRIIDGVFEFENHIDIFVCAGSVVHHAILPLFHVFHMHTENVHSYTRVSMSIEYTPISISNKAQVRVISSPCHFSIYLIPSRSRTSSKRELLRCALTHRAIFVFLKWKEAAITLAGLFSQQLCDGF